ncbi:MAG: hypothetical protein A2169_14350 [Deltaproteobacteria bacterium RBG_13_47_9]|nr:MAG: hypothetical protein A2169_14350 [Deltaproteobacteria bacterium RBG_13_47_9]
MLGIVLWLISMATVCYFSIIPKIDFPLGFKNADLVYHFLAYLWLTCLPFLVIQRIRKAMILAFLMVPLGIGLEFIQMTLPGRFFSTMDIGANILGAIVGMFCGRYLRLSFLKE